MGARDSGPVDEGVIPRVLARHRLLHDASASVVQVADDVVGLHATSPVEYRRLRSFASTDLDRALHERGDLVRMTAMRATQGGIR